MGLLLFHLMLIMILSSSTACFEYNWTDTDCGLYGDPHIRAFSRARGTILLPCRFQAAQLTSYTSTSTICTANVFTFGRVRGGGVYTGGAEISITVMQYYLKVVISDGVLKISVGNNLVPNIIWGVSNQIQLGYLIFKWTFNGPYVTLSAPLCGLTLVYRTISLHPSGIIIQAASRNYIVYDGYHDYVFCGNKTDIISMYEDDGVLLYLDTVDQVLAYRILLTSVTEQLKEKVVFILCCSLIPFLTSQLHPNHVLCESANNVFQGCSSYNRTKAIKVCLAIFSKRRLLKCFSASSETNPMTVFNACLSMVCNPSISNCNFFKAAVSPCISSVHKPPRLLSLVYNSTNCSIP